MVKYISLAALLLGAMPADAGELKPLDGASFDVGAYHGVVYFTDEQDGYRVVATIADGETGLPVRFEATLQGTQNLSISVPGKLGEQSHVFVVSRAGAGLLIEPTPISKEELVIAAPSSAGQQ
jgi:hypothetical protein